MLKTIIFLSVFTLGSVSMADATCPANSTKLMVCKPAPKAGDNEVAVTVFDSISVCQSGSDALLSLEKDGEQSTDYAEVSVRMGGTSYMLTSEDVSTTLSVTTGIASKTAPARLDIEFKTAQLKASATYSCKR
jgi:hypothetical protein